MISRIRMLELREKLMTAEDAARLISDGMTVAVSGFTAVGYPKAVPLALAKRAENGEKLTINLISGA